jgi:hypothetical protein
MAVEQINSDPYILPDIRVELVRYNEWDPNYSNYFWATDSGGYAAAAALDIVNNSTGK